MAESTQDARRKFTIAKAQENLYALNVANLICSVDTEKMGTVYNPYTSTPVVSDAAYSANSYTVGTFAQDADSLQVNRRAIASEIVGAYHWKSSEIDLLSDRGMNMGKGISQTIDGYVLNLPVSTSGVTGLDDGDFGGTAGNAKTSSNTVIDDIINGGIQEIEVGNAYEKKFMVVSAYESNDLRGYLQSTGNMVMDEVLRNGFQSGSKVNKVGTTFSGVDVFQSNNITQVQVLGLATNPTDADTITIGGVEITFVDTLSGGDAEIHIAGTVDVTRANLVEWLNADGADDEAEDTNVGYSAASDEDQATLSRLGITAVNSNSDDDATITTKGVVKVSEDLTDGTDTWGTPYRYLILGEYGSINLYLPSKGMDYEEKPVSGTDGIEVMLRQFYNGVIWTRMKSRVVSIKVN